MANYHPSTETLMFLDQQRIKTKGTAVTIIFLLLGTLHPRQHFPIPTTLLLLYSNRVVSGSSQDVSNKFHCCSANKS